MQPYMVNQSGAVPDAVGNLWFMVVQYVPNILAAVILFIIGWIVAVLLYRLVVAVVRVLRINEALYSAGLGDMAREAGFKLDTGVFLGSLVMWFMILAFLTSSLDVLGLGRVTLFFQQFVLYYVPQIIVAAVIVVVGALFAEFVKKLITGSARAAGAPHGSKLAGSMGKWAVWTFAILAALNQLGVASEFIQTLFTGIVIAGSLAFGLAFGLGGKDAAARTIERVRGEIVHHE